MLTSKTTGLLAIGLLFLMNSLLVVAEVTCGGYSTVLYSGDEIVLTICHGPDSKITRSKSDQWQYCDDAMIQIRNKKDGKTIKYADCRPGITKQIMVHGDTLMLRHFYVDFSNEFEAKPLLIEAMNLRTNEKNYEFEKRFPICSRQDINDAIMQINSSTEKPFDGKTYFTAVYGGFYKLRDCAKSQFGMVLSILNKYQESNLFDGEVSEVLDEVVEEVEIIHAASRP